MPTYEYRCQHCRKSLEAFQRMTDAPLVKCPHCGEDTLQRVVSGGAGVIYKGEGWYVTDYSKTSSGGKEKSESSKTSTSTTVSTATASAPAAPPKETTSTAATAAPSSSAPEK